MKYVKSISFDRDNWHEYHSEDSPDLAKNVGCFKVMAWGFGFIAVAWILGTTVALAMTGPGDLRTAVTVGVIGFALFLSAALSCGNSARAGKEHSALLAQQHEIVELSIIEVHRADRYEGEISGKAGGLGGGAAVLPGVGVGVGGGKFKGTVSMDAHTTWKFFTDQGVFELTDEIYAEYLKAGKPPTGWVREGYQRS